MINKKSGFTLLEILLVIGIIAVLVGIVIVAINPSKTLATVRNSERKSDLKQIDSALSQYYIDNNEYPTSLTSISDLTEICDTGTATSTAGLNCTGLVDLTALVPTYLTAIPRDPSATTTNYAGYKIIRTGRRISLSAPAELGQTITRGADTYSVTYNGNGNTGGTIPSTQTKTENITLTLKTNSGTLTKTGYTFAGWNTLANGSGTNYAEGANYTTNAGVTLFAKWTVNTYTVTFNTNGGDGGSTAIQTLTYNTPTELTANGFTRTGYAFAGWNTLANGSGTNYADTASYTIGAANVTLFARWTGNSYTVTFDSNASTGGTVPSDQTKTYGVTLALASNSGSLVKTGYTFAGWNTLANGSGTNYAEGANYTTNAGVTLFAKWTVNTYTVTFNTNGGDGGSTPTQTLTYNTPTPLTANGFTRTGYTFAGWNTLANGSGTNYADTASYTIGAANVTLFAKWNINTYTVTYDANTSTGGTVPANQTKTYGVTLVLASNSGSLVKTGYTFAGWNTLANGSGTDYAEGANYTANAGVTLFAKWTVADACSHVPTDPDCWSADNITAGHTIWSTENVNTDAMSDTDGRANSDHVMANHANANPWATNNYRAIAACDQYTGGGYTDWYLPAKDELLAAYGVVSGFTSLSYWSSTDTDWWDSAWYFGMGFGGAGRDYKNAAYYHVRCLR